MTHLHLPDGVLPVWLWLAGWLVTLALLWRTGRDPAPQTIAYQGALGGLMLAAMAMPLGPFEYHLSLAGPIGVLLGATGAFQVAFVTSAILAMLGHGGVTVIGLNALVTGAAAAGASIGYRALGRRLRPAWAMAWSTAFGQVLAGALWFAVVGVAARQTPLAGAAAAHTAPHEELVLAIALPLWTLGLAVEGLVAWGVGEFLGRVHPALLPVAPAARRAQAAA